MSFRLVPNSVTLNDLERCKSPNLCLISLNLVAFRPDYVKWLKIHKHFLQQYIIYGDISRGTPLASALKLGILLSLAKI